MGQKSLWLAVVAALSACLAGCEETRQNQGCVDGGVSLCPTTIEPVGDDEAALRRVIGARRSKRQYTDESITLDDAMSLLWAAQGITLSPEEADRHDGRGLRASPSAGPTYPLECYLVATRVDGLEPGLYHFAAETGDLVPTAVLGDISGVVADATAYAHNVVTAAAVIVFTAVMERTAQRYPDRAERYVMMELGHANQNTHLMATARGLGACAIGALGEENMRTELQLPEDHVPYYLLTVGRTAE